MKRKIKKFIVLALILQICIQLIACDMGNPDEEANVIYTKFDNRVYFKGDLYSLDASFIDTHFTFPIISKEKIETIENIQFYDSQGKKIEGSITLIPTMRIDKSIDDNLHFSNFTFSLNIKNIDGLTVSKISLNADGQDVSYDVDIGLHHYYLNPEHCLLNGLGCIVNYTENSYVAEYEYYSLFVGSRLNFLESMVDGIEGRCIAIADGDYDRETADPYSPYTFVDIEDYQANESVYKRNVLKIECDFSEIKKQAVFFKDAFRANLTVGDETVEIMLPYVTHNALLNIYVETCKELKAQGEI